MFSRTYYICSTARNSLNLLLGVTLSERPTQMSLRPQPEDVTEEDGIRKVKRRGKVRLYLYHRQCCMRCEAHYLLRLPLLYSSFLLLFLPLVHLNFGVSNLHLFVATSLHLHLLLLLAPLFVHPCRSKCRSVYNECTGSFCACGMCSFPDARFIIVCFTSTL